MPILEPHLFPAISKAAELALENTQKVIGGLCTPNVCDGYRSEWRPAAYRTLAMTAEISEKIRLLEDNPEISLGRLNETNAPAYQEKIAQEKTIEERTHEVGQTLRTRREGLGYNQAEIARMAGISRTYLNYIEQGNHPTARNQSKPWRPSRKVLTSIAASLELDLDTILNMAGYHTDA